MNVVVEPVVRLNFTETPHPDDETIRALKKGVDEFNFAVAGPDHYAPIWISGKDGAGTVRAGVHAHISWTWLFLDWLWVSRAYRQHGVGTQLLLRTEEIARERGCSGVYLNTFTFQAPQFYVRHGYREFGRLKGMPPGHDRIWFSKALTISAT
jgi:GNAT superfamily N-acetyltransferase